MVIDWSNDGEVVTYLRDLSKQTNPLRHPGYDETVKHADHLAVHVYGKTPKELLEERRPNEPEEIKTYRLKIFKPITKSRCKKILNVLSRINNNKNYHITYPEPSAKVVGETYDFSLETYVNEQYPYFDSFIRWVFDVALRKMVADPNAVCAFAPDNLYEMSENDTVLPRPYGTIYESKYVVDYSDQHFTFLKKEKSLVYVGDVRCAEGNIYCVYTTDSIWEFRQVGNKQDERYERVLIYQHGMGFVPVLKLGGEYVDGTYPIQYESFISGVLPYWDDAIRQYSDKQAVFVQHIYLERVEMSNECDHPKCGTNGAPPGQICNPNREGHFFTCPRCKGDGMITGRSPFGVTRVKRTSLDPTQTPIFPGVEYIDRPTEIVKLLTDDIRQLINDGFGSLNMDFLAETPMNTSGESKAYDRAELTSYLISVSNNIFDNIIFNGLWMINAMRYGKMLTPDELTAQFPTIIKPMDFDIISLNQMVAEFSSSQNMPVELKDEFVLEIMAKKYAGDPIKQAYYKSVIELDPLRGKTSDEKFTAFSNNVISKEDYMISENIYKYVSMAYAKNESFFDLPYQEKYNIILAIAKSELTNKEKVVLEDDDAEEEDDDGNDDGNGGGE